MSDTSDQHLARIGRRNRRLSDELAKLPEILYFETASSRLALENLVTIYCFDPDRFDRMFNRMHRIGLPAHRKYCTPLQALFWMIQDTHLHATGVLLVANYTGINATSGPFKTLERLDQQLSCDRKIIGSRWGAYYPPRCY